MWDYSKLSSRYEIRRMRESDADLLLGLCLQNPQFFRYCGKQPCRELILQDLRITPPGVDASSKFYLGFYDGAVLVAVTDLILGYPTDTSAFIGFFMMNKALQGRQIGSGIVQELCRCLKENGMTAVRLGIDKGNPQSTHFWPYYFY